MAKYVHLFDSGSSFNAVYNSSAYTEPWVSYVVEDGSVAYNKVPGYKYVDLGLPSGILWATSNVGTYSPEEYGDYFAWGEVEPKSAYTWDNYKFGTEYNITKYNTTDEYLMLMPEDDAANVIMGEGWYTPQVEELEELVNNTTSAWTNDWNGTGVAGVVLTSTANTNSIFIPAGGYYGAYKKPSELEGLGNVCCLWSCSRYPSTTEVGGLIAEIDDSLETYLYVDDSLPNRYIGRNIRAIYQPYNPDPIIPEF